MNKKTENKYFCIIIVQFKRNLKKKSKSKRLLGNSINIYWMFYNYNLKFRIIYKALCIKLDDFKIHICQCRTLKIE